MAALDLLIDLIEGLAWLERRRATALEWTAAPSVVARWRCGAEEWRRRVDVVWRNDRRRAAVVFAAPLWLALLLWLLVSVDVLPISFETAWKAMLILESTAALLGVAALVSAVRRRARLLDGDRTVTLTLVTACDGERCRPLHARYPTATDVELVPGPPAVLRFHEHAGGQRADRDLLRLPVPIGHEADARRYVERFRAEFPLPA